MNRPGGAPLVGLAKLLVGLSLIADFFSLRCWILGARRTMNGALKGIMSWAAAATASETQTVPFPQELLEPLPPIYRSFVVKLDAQTVRGGTTIGRLGRAGATRRSASRTALATDVPSTSLLRGRPRRGSGWKLSRLSLRTPTLTASGMRRR